MAHTPQHEKPVLRRWQAALVAAFIAAIALGLAAYAAAASYESVSGLAARHGIPLALLYPAGLDGGLFGVIVVNVALTWLRMTVWWLRPLSRLFAAAVIAANFTAGWPDPVSAVLRIAAPLLFVVLAEAASAVLLRRNRAEGDEEGIPFSRWLLDFRGTARLWRRMKLWRIRSYRAAVDMELSRLSAMEKLAHRFGAGWQQAVPGDLAWMLRAGVRMDEALARVAELTAPPAPEVQAAASTPKHRRASAPKKRPASTRRTTAASPPEVHVPEDVSTRAEALAILDAEPGISGSELGRRLGKSERYGCMLKVSLTADAPVTGEQPRVS